MEWNRAATVTTKGKLLASVRTYPVKHYSNAKVLQLIDPVALQCDYHAVLYYSELRHSHSHNK